MLVFWQLNIFIQCDLFCVKKMFCSAISELNKIELVVVEQHRPSIL
jgi:hypothetical protein